MKEASNAYVYPDLHGDFEELNLGKSRTLSTPPATPFGYSKSRTLNPTRHTLNLNLAPPHPELYMMNPTASSWYANPAP